MMKRDGTCPHHGLEPQAFGVKLRQERVEQTHGKARVQVQRTARWDPMPVPTLYPHPHPSPNPGPNPNANANPVDEGARDEGVPVR